MALESASSDLLSKITIRSALPRELPDVIEVGRSAFTNFTAFGPPFYDDAAVLPALLASARGFDQEGLRVVVADLAGEGRTILAYALWTPYAMRFGGSTIRALSLAPLAVHARFQNMGLGARLMEDGIARARTLGVNMITILGHEDYYPRFGLSTGILGHSGIEIPLPPPGVEETTHIRPVKPSDLAQLEALFESLSADQDGLHLGDGGLAPWLSNTHGILAAVYEKEGQVLAYSRFDARPHQNPHEGVLRFLARNRESADYLLGWMARKAQWTGTVHLPLSAQNPAVRNLFPDARVISEPWSAGMAMVIKDCPLKDAPSLSDYLASIKAGKITVPNVSYPPMFDF